MDRTSYETLSLELDVLFEAALEARSRIAKRIGAVMTLIPRPSLAEIAADPDLRAAWIGAQAPCLKAQREALAPLLREDEEVREKLRLMLDATCARHGWTVEGWEAELDRRVDLSISSQKQKQKQNGKAAP